MGEKTPIEMMLDGIAWTAVVPDRPEGPDNSDGVPFATHEGVLKIGDMPPLRCYRLSNGQSVFNADDLQAFFEDMHDE